MYALIHEDTLCTQYLNFSPMPMSETWECGSLSTTCTGEPPEDWHQTGGRHVSVPFQPNGTLSVLTWGPQVQLRAMSLAHLEVLGDSLPDSSPMAYLINLCLSISKSYLTIGCGMWLDCWSEHQGSCCCLVNCVALSGSLFAIA